MYLSRSQCGADFGSLPGFHCGVSDGGINIIYTEVLSIILISISIYFSLPTE